MPKKPRNLFYSSRIDKIVPYCESNGEGSLLKSEQCRLASERGRECQFTRPNLPFHGAREEEGREDGRTVGMVTVAIEVSTVEEGIQFGQRQGCNFPDLTICEAKDVTQEGPEARRFSSKIWRCEVEWNGESFSFTQSFSHPIPSVRSGAVANAKIACHLVSANKVSGAIERKRKILLCSKYLRPHSTL